MRIKKKYKILLLDLLGILFLFWGIAAIANSMYIQNPTQIFYMCYLGLILIGVGILTKRSFLIMSQVYILAIPLLIWDIDFIYWILFDESLWGVTDYFFLERTLNLGKIISLQHLVTIPIAIYAAKVIGLKRKDAWKWSAIQAILVYLAVSLFTPKELNINCVFDPCINVYFGLPYRLTWFLIFSLMILVSVMIINRLPFLWNDKENKK